MKKLLIPLALFLVLAGFLFVGLSRDPREVPSPLVGKSAPPFAAPTLADAQQRISREDLLGRAWVLNVWASWCGACRDEHPVLVEWSRRPGQTVKLIGLNYKDQRADGLQWLRQLGNPYTTSIFDPDGRIGLDYGVYGVPETFVIDAQGVVRMKHIGPVTPEVLRDKIEPLLKQLNG
ncbi:DsbE family thiol:disulfide interchange protein [Ideonella sp. 4Y16]|uniref:DsbE family thiol:disulfide interchange protein n=1 Tax=Ideonella alba TaxID=2824118 RepID=A0A940Y6U5_9BURK|nr:DsbE family thiol:disulfide interchange protein [Ideonella alba]MBQ0929848.1 DsbE family thiol:disulfide interchange protein [Ideonella alba]MBQ0942080.1 DsbE family thiol:disulfide interchange protein [Ideonella alba]